MHTAHSTTSHVSAAYIVHEVNQPLAAIVISAEMALQRLMSDPPNLDLAREAIERVIGNSYRAVDVARSARDQVCKGASLIADFDVHQAIRDALDLIAPVLQRRGISVETDFAGPRGSVRGDRMQLARLTGNLIGNAIDAMKAVEDRPRRLRIDTARDECGHLLVSVEDSGVGIDPAKIDRIFDPFFTTKPEGMGLGLAICRSIVEMHGGRLWALPNRPHGCIFRFTLPVRLALSSNCGAVTSDTSLMARVIATFERAIRSVRLM